MILESIKTVLKELRINKMRTFLTMIGIIIGIFSITIIFTLSNTTKDYVENSLSSMETENIQLFVFTNNNVEHDLIDSVITEYEKNNSKVKKIGRLTEFTYKELTNLLEANQNDSTQIYYNSYGSYFGIDENYLEINSSFLNDDNLLYGRLLTKKDIINNMPYAVLREDSALLLFGRTNVIGEKININNNEFEVIGVIHSQNQEELLSVEKIANVYIPYYYAISYLDTEMTKETVYYISLTDNKHSEEVKSEIKKKINEYISSEQYMIFTYDLDVIMEGINSTIEIVELVFAAIAGLSILVGGIGVMNIMLVSVSERIKETGLRMALGAKNSDIVFQFLIEGIIITIISGIIGIILALSAASIINVFIASQGIKEFSLTLDFLSMIKTILFCGLIGIVFGIYPAIKAGKLDPVEALKYE